MPVQPANTRQTCSYCCKPFTEQDPGRLVERFVYLVPCSAPTQDPNQPECAAVQLAPDLILCPECCKQWGYETVEENAGKGARKRPATAQEDGGGESVQRQKKGARNRETDLKASKLPADTWALAMEREGVWHVFKKFGGDWRHEGKAIDIAKGRQEELLQLFAGGGGFLSEVEAVKSVRRTLSRDDKQRIMKIIKPEISRLRKVIRKNLHLSDESVDPLPRDKHTPGWQSTVQIGYAIQNDQGRLQFKLHEELSREEALDV